MAATYDELKEEIQRWADNNNPNFVAEIPTFISDAENWIRAHLHTREMECLLPTPLVPPGVTEDTLGVYDLPTNWGGHKSVVIKDDELILHYWVRIPSLSASNPDNWLLLKRPDLYRFAALAGTESFLKNDNRVGLWSTRAQNIVQEMEAHDEHDLYSGGPLISRAVRPWTADGDPGRLVYLAPYEFFDAEARGTLDHLGCIGVFTTTESHIRILPKPPMPTP